MSVIEFHVWAEGNPVGEANKLAVITDADVVVGESGPAIWYEPALHGLGGRAGFSINRHSELATSTIIREDNFVRVKVPQIQAGYLEFGWWMRSGEFHLIDSDEEGGENITIEGPGLLHKLATGSLWHSSTVDDQPARGSADREGLWWWINEPYGAMLTRIMEEGRHSPYPDPAEVGSPLEFFEIDFSRTSDSDSVAWPNIDNEFQVDIGIDLMTVADKLRESGNLYVIGDASDVDSLQVHCYQSYGDDKTGDFGSGTVRFEKAVNIATELVRKSESGQRINRLLLRDSDGNYSTEILPGTEDDVEHWGFWDANQTNDDTLLNAIGLNVLRASQTSVEPLGFEAAPGKTPTEGLYLAGLHYDVGDTVTVHTGTDPEDYEEADQLVVGYRVSVREGARDDTATHAQRSLKIEPQLNYYAPRYGASNIGEQAGHAPGCKCIRLCEQGTPGSEEVTRLYFSQADASFDPAADAAWDNTAPTEVKQLKLTADGTMGTSPISNTEGGLVAGRDICYWRASYGPLNAGMAADIAAGGAVLSGQLRVHTRQGVGIDESQQTMIHQVGVRVTTGATTTIRGTALPLHTLANASGTTIWTRIATHRNNTLPPATSDGILDAVAGTAAGDYLLFELGSRNFTPTGVTSGGSMLFTSNAPSDLPVDETTQTALNCWLELHVSGSGATEGDLPLDTVRQGEEAVGTASKATRCDHQHAHGYLSTDEAHYHNRSDIEGTTDLGLDDLVDVDLTTPPDDGDVLIYDATEELWLPGAGGGGVTLSDDTPLVESGSGDEGTSGEASRSDHVHPDDGGGGGGSPESWETVVADLSGKVHRWKFEEASGNFDDAISTLDLIANGSISYAQSSPLGDAASFTGGFAESSGLGSIPVGDAPRTVVIVWKKNTVSGGAVVPLFGYGAAGTRTMFEMYGSTVAQLTLATPTLHNWAGGVAFGDGLWHITSGHSAGNGSQLLTMYFDGVYINAAAGGAMATSSANNFHVASEFDDTDPAAITVTDCIVFDRYLAKHEMDRLYDALRAVL